jgi:hypothetical protein
MQALPAAHSALFRQPISSGLIAAHGGIETATCPPEQFFLLTQPIEFTYTAF